MLIEGDAPGISLFIFLVLSCAVTIGACINFYMYFNVSSIYVVVECTLFLLSGCRMYKSGIGVLNVRVKCVASCNVALFVLHVYSVKRSTYLPTA